MHLRHYEMPINDGNHNDYHVYKFVIIYSVKVSAVIRWFTSKLKYFS